MNRTRLYVRLSEEDLALLDTFAQTLNYPTRTEFTTSLILSVLHGKDLNKSISAIRTCVESEIQIKDTFFSILDEYAFPILSMRGVDYTYRHLKGDFKTWMYQRCKTIPTDEELYSWLHAYVSIKRIELKNHRANVLLASYEDEHAIEEEV